MKFNVPTWRVWLVTLLAALWGIFAITMGTRGEWAVFALCAVMFLWNVFQLWTFTRRPRDP